ncbi:YtxH domain-containing protein [Tuanshanicoccus lijuaniae]|uniref:YtxH domain-containing protein n=1 Tax=Aerococcaceae bacterium zg-1292 TaxID=2774330 RepID=UPI00193551D7|nr:YtxH domain-containing protein [Aerococcaceae bacterium zg-1292]MBS4456843.1 YtxH domain-containing protein [Aerococcaceae bacterium zg-A91]MBS4458679.1 YtxH domain-containing protein [Aerococcaceae bacterium zg-BR33]QQA36649.1 YtxH domain-containing protein [Aerococcaceae bacterium zg-1292]
MMRRQNNNGGFLLGAIFGAAVAGITALLYAPKAGEDLRKDFTNEVDNMLDRAKDYKDLAIEKGVELYDAAAETATEVSDDIKLNMMLQAENLSTKFDELKGEGKKAYEDAKAKAENVAQDAKDKAQDAAEGAKDKAEDVADDVKVAADNAKDKAQDVADAAKEKAEEAADKTKEKAEEAKDAVKRA